MSADVAVIVRTKDRPLLLARALRSIAGQTVTPRQVVVVNDGGDAARVESAIERVREGLADEVVVVHHDAPVGRARGMNVGVTASSSATFVFHDDDDSWHPRFLEATAQHLDAHPDAAAVATVTEVVWERIDGDAITELHREVYQSGMTAVTLTETLYRNGTPPICLVYRRSAYDEAGGYDDALVALADWDFLLRVLRIAPVGFLGGEPLAFWHHRKDDLSASGNSAYADAASHAVFNGAIRDAYLRRSMADVDDIGAALFVADGFRRIDEKADTARAEAARVAQRRSDDHRDHLEVVHASLVEELAGIRAAIDRMQLDVERLERLASRGISGRLRDTGATLGRRLRGGGPAAPRE